MDRVRSNSKMAFAGIAGAVTYAIADLFLYWGTQPFDANSLSL